MKEWLLSYASAFHWNAAGLLLSLLGVLLLFRFGMPFRLSTSGGGDHLVTEQSSDPASVEPTYQFLAWTGLVAIVGGTAYQLAGAYVGYAPQGELAPFRAVS